MINIGTRSLDVSLRFSHSSGFLSMTLLLDPVPHMGGFHSHGGTPINAWNGWFIYVYFMEHPMHTWMMTGGSPISGNLHMYTYLTIANVIKFQHNSNIYNVIIFQQVPNTYSIALQIYVHI